jgi:hypothetical protein
MSRVGDTARKLHADALTWPPDEGGRRTVNANGRVITLEVDDEIDECDQFRVALSVDGKERWEAWFTNKSDRLSGEPADA